MTFSPCVCQEITTVRTVSHVKQSPIGFQIPDRGTNRINSTSDLTGLTREWRSSERRRFVLTLRGNENVSLLVSPSNHFDELQEVQSSFPLTRHWYVLRVPTDFVTIDTRPIYRWPMQYRWLSRKWWEKSWRRFYPVFPSHWKAMAKINRCTVIAKVF